MLNTLRQQGRTPCIDTECKEMSLRHSSMDEYIPSQLLIKRGLP